MRTGKRVLRVLVSLGVSGVCVFLSLRHTDPRAVASAIAGVSRWALIGYLVVLLAVHVVRALRWQLLLMPLGRLGFARVNSATAVGFMLLTVLPLRLGELARPLLISRPASGGGPRLARGGALASILVERVIDGLAVGVLGIVSLHLLATKGTNADLARKASAVITAGFGAVCLGLVFAFFMRERTVALVRRLGRPISQKLADRVAHMLDNFIRGLHLGSAASVLGVLALTVVHWLLHAVGYWMVAEAFGLELTPLMIGTVLASNVFGGMIPAGPGNVGTSQLSTMLGVSLFIPGALTLPAVAAYANTVWLMQIVQTVGVGMIFMMTGHVSLAGLFSSPEAEPPAGPVGAPAGGDASPSKAASTG